MSDNLTMESVVFKIKSTLLQIERTGELLLSADLEGNAEETAMNVLTDLAEKDIILNEILKLADSSTPDELHNLSHDIIKEADALCLNFE